MTVEIETMPASVVSDAPPCWPPVSHIIRKEDEPVKPGTIALCGEKMMGIDLGRAHQRPTCKKCDEIFRREARL